jgi:hypothetical protein
MQRVCINLFICHFCKQHIKKSYPTVDGPPCVQYRWNMNCGLGLAVSSYGEIKGKHYETVFPCFPFI